MTKRQSNPSGVRTLVLIRRPGQILLGQKKRGFGAGHWNGFGGKVETGETIIAAAQREVQEECGLTVAQLTQRGQLSFSFAHDPLVLDVHIFMAEAFTGEPYETAEMNPQWFRTTDIPYDQMWAADRHWLPLFLQGKAFIGEFFFADWDTIQYFSVKEVARQAEPWHINTMVNADVEPKR